MNMRHGSNNRRQRSRHNQRKNFQSGGGNGQQRNYVVDSNGPTGRLRGTAQQLYEKYMALARDASSMDDRVGLENYLQHADHYYRLLMTNGGPRPNGGEHDGAHNGADQSAEGSDSDEETEASPGDPVATD